MQKPYTLADFDSTIVDDKLCRPCQGLVEDILTGNVGDTDNWSERNPPSWPTAAYSKHYSDLRALAKSATQGCQLCQLFDEKVKDRLKDYPEDLEGSKGPYSLWVSCIDDASLYEKKTDARYAQPKNTCPWVHIKFGRPADISEMHWSHGSPLYFEFWIEPGERVGVPSSGDLSNSKAIRPDSKSHPTHRYKFSHRILADSASEEAFGLVRKWYNDCQMNHLGCRRQAVDLPRRVIDVSPQIPLLHFPDGEKGDYATLSHSWGDNGFKTTKDNIEAYSKELPSALMPSTFQDAIEITRQCGIKYLWIDALCILQDSASDWDEQAAVMCEIYQNATLNISNLDGLDARSGILHKRSRKSIPVGLLMSSDSGTVCNVNVRSLFATRLEYSNMINYTHLDSRSWCLQERLLSTANLLYGQQMAWECRTSTSMESGFDIEVFADGTITHPNGEIHWQKNHGIKRLWHHEMETFPYQRWYLFVEEYTRRNLTKHFDRLPAASGIARAYQHESGDKYLAGLWSQDLPRALLWRTNVGTSPGGSYRAPSWSWASVEGSIFAPRKEDELVSDDADAMCIHSIDVSTNIDPFGAVSAGQMVVTGLVQKSSYTNNPLLQDGFQPWLHWNKDRDAWLPRNRYDSPPPTTPRECFCLRVGRTRLEGSTYKTYFLVLETVLDQGDSVYRRIGLGSHNIDIDPARGHREFQMDCPEKMTITVV